MTRYTREAMYYTADRFAGAAATVEPVKFDDYNALIAYVDTVFESLDIKYRPASSDGLVRIHATGVYVPARDIARYERTRRYCAMLHTDHITAHPVEVYAYYIRKADGDEAAALTMLGLNYHDDRGDGLLYVPAFRSVKYRTAWTLACKDCGIAKSRVRVSWR